TGPVKILCDGVAPEIINKLIYTAHLAGLQIAAQADSGAALNMCLDAFEQAVKARAMNTRHLIIHAKAADLDQLKRMRDLRLGAVIEPEMAVHSDAGCRWRGMLRSGITFCAGSGAGLNSYDDNQRVNVNPLLGLYYAVNRREAELNLANAKDAHNPIECLSIAEAIEAYTYSAAWNGNAVNRRGEIALWRDADLVVLNQDPFKTEPDKLKDFSVYMTVCGGRIIEQEEFNN
ncbi:MAG: amidohydrolase family protein, partial [Synergistaceae bacterium]|nr:amidohydrolase family protein [Synergistaceae bacterium]